MAKKHTHKRHALAHRRHAPENDAMNIAALRMYMLTLEHLALAIYRTGTDPKRPRYPGLRDKIASYIKDLRKFGKEGRVRDVRECDDPEDELCDGLCYPKGDCSRGRHEM
jgi:hypothetical protein